MIAGYFNSAQNQYLCFLAGNHLLRNSPAVTALSTLNDITHKSCILSLNTLYVRILALK
jgi:hypothetical protein